MNAMTELEERLAGPGGDALRETLAHQLADLEERLRLQLRASLPRPEFADASALADAARAAQEVLRQWPTGLAQQDAAALQSPLPLPRR